MMASTATAAAATTDGVEERVKSNIQKRMANSPGGAGASAGKNSAGGAAADQFEDFIQGGASGSMKRMHKKQKT